MTRWLRAGIACLLIGAATMVIGSMLPLAIIRNPVEELVPGRALTLTEERFASIRAGLRLTAAIFVCAGIFLACYRRRISGFCDHLLSHRQDCRTIWFQESFSCFRDPWAARALVIFALLGFYLRAVQMWRPIFLDEAFAYLSYWKFSLLWTISDYSAPNNHLFHSILVFVSTRFFGDSILALRLPAFIGGMLVIPATFAVTKVLYNRAAAIAGTALVASAPPLIDYSAKARGYSWQCLFLLLVAFFGNRISGEEPTRLDWVAFTIFSILSMYTIPTGVVPFSAVVIWMLLVQSGAGPTNRLWPFVGKLLPILLLIAILTLLLYVPPIVVSGPGAVLTNKFIAPMTASEFRDEEPGLALATWANWNDGVPVLARWVINAGLILGIVGHSRIAKRRISLTLVMILLCIAFVLVARTPIAPRVWLFVWMFSLITAGAGIALILSNPWVITSLALLVALFVGIAAQLQRVYVGSPHAGSVQGIPEAVIWLERYTNSRDRIVMSQMIGPPLAYALHRRSSRLEPEVDCIASHLPMCQKGEVLGIPPPDRLIAVIAKHPENEDGHSTNPSSWQVQETTPTTLLFNSRDARQYTQPRVVRDQIGLVIWESQLIK